MTHLEEIIDIWDAYERDKCEIGTLIKCALDLQKRTKNEEVLDSINRFLIAVGWI